MLTSTRLRRAVLLGACALVAAVLPDAVASAGGSGAVVVYTRTSFDAGGLPSSELVVRDLGSGLDRVVVPRGDHEFDGLPVLSPDGSRIAFTTTRGGGSYGLATVSPTGAGLTRLTDPPEGVVDEDAAYDPDGSGLWFTRFDPTGPVGLWRVPAGGGAAVDTGIAGSSPAVSPDSSRLAYVDPAGALVVRRLDTGSETRVGPRSAGDVTWSPDGARLAYTQYLSSGAVLHLVAPDGTGDAELAGTSDGRHYATVPAWLPDGQSLVYGYDTTGQDGGQQLWAVDLATGRARAVVRSAPGQDAGPGTAQGPVPAPVATAGQPSRFVAVTPTRVFDSRAAQTAVPGPKGRIGARASVDLAVAGTAGVPDDATAVVLNVTAVSPSTGTYVTAYPTGSPVPSTSNVNLGPGTTVPNAVTVALGTGGQVSLYNSDGAVDLVADLAGYYVPSATPGSTGFGALVRPVRAYDSRPGQPGPGPKARLGAGGTVDVAVRGVLGVPADATAVVVNLTGVASTTSTLLRAYPTPDPGDAAVPVVSTVNLPPYSNVANLAVVRIGTDGSIRLRNDAGTLDAVVDISGYYSPSATAEFVPLAPTRFLDTRSGLGAAPLALGTAEYADLQVAGARGVPAGAVAVAANLTAVNPSAATLLRAYPAGAALPGVSNLNVSPSTIRANAAYLLPDPAGGRVRIRNDAGSVHVLADVAGWFADPDPTG